MTERELTKKLGLPFWLVECLGLMTDFNDIIESDNEEEFNTNIALVRETIYIVLIRLKNAHEILKSLEYNDINK